MSDRRRAGVTQEEEDAGTLKFGPEFQDADCMSLAQVRYILEMSRDRMLMEKGENGISNIFKKTLDYSQRFSKFTNKQSVDNIRALFPAEEFEPFEAAQLANLCCETTEEAKQLIPSLTRIQDDRLQNLLNEMTTLLKYQ